MKNNTFTLSDKVFLKIGLIGITLSLAAITSYVTLIFALDRHPLAPFIEPDRVLALQLFSSACGIPGPSFTVMPMGFELEEKTIKLACETKLKRAANS